jgi:hypothetical protein
MGRGSHVTNLVPVGQKTRPLLPVTAHTHRQTDRQTCYFHNIDGFIFAATVVRIPFTVTVFVDANFDESDPSSPSYVSVSSQVRNQVRKSKSTLIFKPGEHPPKSTFKSNHVSIPHSYMYTQVVSSVRCRLANGRSMAIIGHRRSANIKHSLMRTHPICSVVICPRPDLPVFFFWKYISLHVTSKASGLGLGLVFTNVSVRVKVRHVLRTLQASGQFKPQT